MIAVDTNVVVRLVTNDDPAQAALAAALFEAEPVFLSVSVMLETEWVLRSVYGLSRQTVANALLRLLENLTVTVEAPGRMDEALSAYAVGFDFADALHRASAADAGCERIVTFDGRFRRLAAAHAGSVAVVAP